MTFGTERDAMLVIEDCANSKAVPLWTGRPQFASKPSPKRGLGFKQIDMEALILS